MSELSFAFLACPANLEDPAPAVDWLTQSLDRQWRRNAARFVAVTTKFKASRGVRTFNVGTNYPPELALLATHGSWAKAGQPDPRQCRDAQALFCLHRFAQAHPDIGQIVLVTAEPGEDDDLSFLEAEPSGPFHWLGNDPQVAETENTGPVVFNQNDPDAEAALNLALDIALTGAIYGMRPYSLAALLDQAAKAAAIAKRGMPAGETGLKS